MSAHHLLTVSAIAGHNAANGFDSPKIRRKTAAPSIAAFLCAKYGDSNYGGAVWEGESPAGPNPGLSTRMVPPPSFDSEVAGSKNRKIRSSTMANHAKSAGARSKNTQPLLYSDGSVGSITWVREDTAIKRLRRHLAKLGHSLHVTREMTPDRYRLGEFFVRDADGIICADNFKLSDLMRAYGLLAEDEFINYPFDKGWRYCMTRKVHVMVNGVRCEYLQPLTREYSTSAAARKAAEHIEDREDLVMWGYDATHRRTQEGSHDA